MLISNLRIASKIWLPVVIFSIALACVAIYAAQDKHSLLMDGRKDKVKSVVEEAHSVIEYYTQQANSGSISIEQAQDLAKNAVKAMRYNENEYLWINDMDVVIVMHPIKPQLDGKKLDKLEDPNGKRLFVEMVETVKTNNGAGFVDYLWSKPDSEVPVEKISYVKLSSGWGWIVGSGLYLDDVEAAFMDTITLFIIAVLAVMIISGAISFIVTKNITSGLEKLTSEMNALAHGNLDTNISNEDRADEIGDMSRSLVVFKQKSIEAQSLKDEQEVQREQMAEERRKNMIELADNLQNRMSGVIDQMGGVVHRLGSSASTMTHNADETSKQSSSVAAISDQTSSNVQTVASAAEELNASSAEIARVVNQTNATAEAAAHEAEETNKVILGLSGAASRIGEVVGMIQDIAEQTNLLALNATIEAARAGDAGKGFAVVASEVKNLANQTASATDEVTQQIQTIQKETEHAVNAIGGITSTIGDVREASSAIMAAVEEQHAAIQEISRNVQEAARGTEEISLHISSVSRDADQTKTSALDVQTATSELETSSSTLDETMSNLLEDMRQQASVH